jgi:hypothetical protein
MLLVLFRPVLFDFFRIGVSPLLHFVFESWLVVVPVVEPSSIACRLATLAPGVVQMRLCSRSLSKLREIFFFFTLRANL